MRFVFSENRPRPAVWLWLLLAALLLAAGVLWLTRSPVNDIGELSAGVMAGLKGQAPPRPMAGETPAGGAPPLPSLHDLLPGLEAKVAANPGDMDSRLLLAQTYAEVGQRDKALQSLQRLRAEQPGDGHIAFVYATVLMSGDAAQLRQAYDLLEESRRKQPANASAARYYQGEIRLRQGDRAGAQAIWQEQLRALSPGDPHRAAFEQAIATLSAPAPNDTQR